MITQNEYNVTKQNNRELYCLFNLLNNNFQKVDEISGVVINDSWTNDATSDIRRTGSITIVPDDDNSYKIQSGSKIWLDKYIQVYIGIKDVLTDEIVYTNMGIYIINNPEQTFSSTENTITLNLIDLMAKLTGLRNGSLEGYVYQITEGANIKNVMISLLNEMNFTKYIINIADTDYSETPYDISVDGNGTYYDILSKLAEINVNYQMYFDVDGVFHYEKIPSGKNEQVMIDNDIWDECYINHNVNTSYEDLKNDIIVIGKTHDITNYGGTAIMGSNGQYVINLYGSDDLYSNIIIGFVAPEKAEHPIMDIYLHYTDNDGDHVKELLNMFIYDENGDMAVFEETENSYYVVKYKKSINILDVYSETPLDETYSGDLLASISNSMYYVKDSSITAKSISELADETKITFVTPISGNSSISDTYVVINNLEPIKLNMPIPLKDNCKYVVTFSKQNSDNDYLLFLGEVTPMARVKEENEESPFYVDGTVGDIKIVLQGGEYDNIYSTNLAEQRAKYELYTRCRLLDNISITCVPIYWADVNWVIKIKLPTSDEEELYIIKNISTSGGISGTQTIQAMKYYSFYDW